MNLAASEHYARLFDVKVTVILNPLTNRKQFLLNLSDGSVYVCRGG